MTNIVWRKVGDTRKTLHAFEDGKATTTLCGFYHNCNGLMVPPPDNYRIGCKRCHTFVDQREKYDAYMVSQKTGSPEPKEEGFPTLPQAMSALRELVALIDESGVVPPLPVLLNARDLLARFKGKP